MSLGNLVHQLPLFATLSDAEKRELAKASIKIRHFRENEFIIRQRSEGISFFILLKGLARVEFGNKLILKLKPGAVFGEAAFLSGSGTRISDVISNSDDAVALEINEGDYQRFPPHVREKIKGAMLEVLVRKLDMMNRENYKYQKILDMLSLQQVAAEPEELSPEDPNFPVLSCRRARVRHPLHLDVVYYGESGWTTEGCLLNIITRGAFMAIPQGVTFLPDEKGVLNLPPHLAREEVDTRFSCRVVRVEEAGIALAWNEG
ncbi:MAG: cyclic nucleotide-binding domain-containing protein [Magnetococcales bacterium]|nr:cyclic nucleotide-binding domain-containing protein [Magnetococcales bacterium]